MNDLNNLIWQIERIIDTANILNTQPNNNTMSAGERIAAAFVLDEPGLLPDSFSMIDAFNYLTPTWQTYITEIRRHHMHLIK